MKGHCHPSVGSQVDADQRTVVILSDIQGLKYSEIAESVGVSLGTVKSRLNRGRRKLRDFLIQQPELLPTRYRLYDKAGGAGGLASLMMDWLADWPGTRRLGRE